MVKSFLKSLVWFALASVSSPMLIGALVDTDGNAATNQTLLGDIDMGVGTLGDLKSYVEPSKIADGTNTIDAAGNVWKVVTGWRVYTNGIIAVGWTAWGYEIDAGPDGYSYELHIGPDETEGISIARATFPSNAQNWADEYETTYDLDYDFYGLTYGDTIRAVHGGTTNLVGRIALTNDIPFAVVVVAPSTNAVAGQAADAKATGTALYTGFTEWKLSGVGYEPSVLYEVRIDEYDGGGEVFYIASLMGSDGTSETSSADSLDDTSVTFPYAGITATRRLITPTKTSQLINDGSNGTPFAVVSQIPLNYETVSNMAMSAVSTNALRGQTYDFSKNYDIIKATADLIRLFGGTVTNDPTANGGN